MEVPTLAERRKVATARRQPPKGLYILELAADGDGSHGPTVGPHPEELRLSSTCDDGQIATWFDDAWWLEALQRWKDTSLRIHILPTPDALLHPIVLHELEMVKRLQVPWRLVGHCYLSDIGHSSQAAKAALSPYDDVRIIDKDRPFSDVYQVIPSAMTLEELFERLHNIQTAEKVSTPLFTRALEPRA